MKTFTMYRRGDISATHDENQRNDPDEPQFEGVVFSDGTVAIHWMTAKGSTSVWACLEDMLAIHGHPEYDSELIWHDGDPDEPEWVGELCEEQGIECPKMRAWLAQYDSATDAPHVAFLPAGKSENKDGLPIKTGEDVGLVAGMHEDGVSSVHDKHMPDWVRDSRGCWLCLVEDNDFHERVENAVMQAGGDYYEGHRVAQEAQHARQRQRGFDPNEIEEMTKPYMDAAAHEARARGNTTAEVGNEPYRVTDESEMREDGNGEDQRFILDIDGNRYESPSFWKILGVEVVTGKGEAGWCVLDPNSGKVMCSAETQKGVERRMEKIGQDYGRARLKKRFEGHDQVSQQQLRERHKERHLEAEIEA